MKTGYGKGNNVKTGCYSAGGEGPKTGNGKHGAPKAVTHTHRMNSAAPKIKGHHFQGSRSKKTGKTFGKGGY